MATKIKQLAASIKRRNRAFARMSPARKRVTIAKDVLEALGKGRIRATQGQYWNVKVPAKKVELGTDLSSLLPELPTCNACAIGSMFMCAIARADRATLINSTEQWESTVKDAEQILVAMPDDGSRARAELWEGNAHGYVSRYYSDAQRTAIEAAFEHDNETTSWSSSAPFSKRVSARRRLELIMKNIVRNGGTFKPKDPKMLEAIGR